MTGIPAGRRPSVQSGRLVRRVVNVMKITVDQDNCVPSRQCVPVAPEVFDQRAEDGITIEVDG